MGRRQLFPIQGEVPGVAGGWGRWTGSSAESAVQFDEWRDQPVAHLLVDAKDRRIVGVVVRADPLESGLDRLPHRFVLQRASDTAAAHGPRRPRENCPRHTAHHWAIENRTADDRVAFASDPEILLTDARVLEPESHPLGEREDTPGDGGRDVLLRLDHSRVELSILLWVAVLGKDEQLNSNVAHLAPALVARGEYLVTVLQEVQLGHSHPAVFAITEAFQRGRFELEVFAHPRDSGRRSFTAKPFLRDLDQRRVKRVAPRVRVQAYPDGAVAVLLAVPQLVRRAYVCDGGPIAKSHLAHALFHLVGHPRSEEHTSELQSQSNLVCRLLLEKKNTHVDPLHWLHHHTILTHSPAPDLPALGFGLLAAFDQGSDVVCLTRRLLVRVAFDSLTH